MVSFSATTWASSSFWMSSRYVFGLAVEQVGLVALAVELGLEVLQGQRVVEDVDAGR